MGRGSREREREKDRGRRRKGVNGGREGERSIFSEKRKTRIRLNYVCVLGKPSIPILNKYECEKRRRRNKMGRGGEGWGGLYYITKN